MDRVHEIVGSRRLHQRGIRGRHVGIAILDTGAGVKELRDCFRKGDRLLSGYRLE